MKMVRFLISSLLVAGMLAVAPVAFADEGGGGAGPRGPFNQDPGPGGGGGGTECWNPECAHGGWDIETQMSYCDYLPSNGKCFCNFNTADGGPCEAT